MICGAALAVFLAVCPGQIVNILPYAQEAEDGFSAELEFSVDARTGNTERMLWTVSGAGMHRGGGSMTLLVLSGDFGSKGGERFASSVFAHARRRQRLRFGFEAEGFVQGASDEFRRLELRSLAGGGARLHWQSRIGSAALGGALMGEHERLQGGEASLLGRWSSYLYWSVGKGGAFRYAQTTFVQPRLDDPGDVRLLHESSLSLEASDRFRAPISVRVSWDSRPPPGVRRTDVQVKSSLRLRL